MLAGSQIRATLAVAALLLLGACTGGGTYESTAVDLIEGELEESIGLGTLNASCDEPSSDVVGTTFLCLATTNSGQTVNFTAVIDEEDHVQAVPTNLIRAELVGNIEERAVQLLSEQYEVDLTAESMDCGTEMIVLDESSSLSCTFTEPETAAVFDAIIRVIRDAGETEIEVALAPRS